MKLTKEEKKRLYEDIANDLPENYRVFSPWMSLWLVNIVISIMGTASLAVILGEEINLPIPVVLGIGLFACLFLCAANAVIVQGYKGIGTKLLRSYAYLLSLCSLVVLFILSSEIVPTQFVPLVAGLLSVSILHSKQFFVFAHHRAQTMAWARERINKNEAFKEQIRQQRK